MIFQQLSRNGWATAQLCHNTMGHCIVTQQVLGGLLARKLYCNIEVCSGKFVLQWVAGIVLQ